MITDGQVARIGAAIGERLGLEMLVAFETELRRLRAIATQASETVEIHDCHDVDAGDPQFDESLDTLRELLNKYFAPTPPPEPKPK